VHPPVSRPLERLRERRRGGVRVEMGRTILGRRTCAASPRCAFACGVLGRLSVRWSRSSRPSSSGRASRPCARAYGA
jgi:hypothetical protein